MRRFLAKILLFACIIALTLLGGELFLRFSPNSYTYKDEYMREHGDKVAVLILGNSHNYSAIRPDCLSDSAFNLANVSQNYEYDLALLKQYLPLMPRLHTVVLNLSFCSLRDKPYEEGIERVFATNYKIHMGIDKHSDFSRYNVHIAEPELYARLLRRALLGEGLDCDSLGWATDFNHSNFTRKWESTGRSKALQHTSDRTYYERNLGILEQICRLCRERGIRLVLVTTPAHASYRRELEPEQRAEMRSTADMLINKYGIEYYDYLADPRFVYDDFFDPDHLIDTSAEKFTRILRHDLKL